MPGFHPPPLRPGRPEVPSKSSTVPSPPDTPGGYHRYLVGAFRFREPVPDRVRHYIEAKHVKGDGMQEKSREVARRNLIFLFNILLIYKYWAHHDSFCRVVGEDLGGWPADIVAECQHVFVEGRRLYLESPSNVGNTFHGTAIEVLVNLVDEWSRFVPAEVPLTPESESSWQQLRQEWRFVYKTDPNSLLVNTQALPTHLRALPSTATPLAISDVLFKRAKPASYTTGPVDGDQTKKLDVPSPSNEQVLSTMLRSYRFRDDPDGHKTNPAQIRDRSQSPGPERSSESPKQSRYKENVTPIVEISSTKITAKSQVSTDRLLQMIDTTCNSIRTPATTRPIYMARRTPSLHVEPRVQTPTIQAHPSEPTATAATPNEVGNGASTTTPPTSTPITATDVSAVSKVVMNTAATATSTAPAAAAAAPTLATPTTPPRPILRLPATLPAKPPTPLWEKPLAEPVKSTPQYGQGIAETGNVADPQVNRDDDSDGIPMDESSDDNGDKGSDRTTLPVQEPILITSNRKRPQSMLNGPDAEDQAHTNAAKRRVLPGPDQKAQEPLKVPCRKKVSFNLVSPSKPTKLPPSSVFHAPLPPPLSTKSSIRIPSTPVLTAPPSALKNAGTPNTGTGEGGGQNGGSNTETPALPISASAADRRDTKTLAVLASIMAQVHEHLHNLKPLMQPETSDPALRGNMELIKSQLYALGYAANETKEKMKRRP